VTVGSGAKGEQHSQSLSERWKFWKSDNIVDTPDLLELSGLKMRPPQQTISCLKVLVTSSPPKINESKDNIQRKAEVVIMRAQWKEA